MLRHGLEVEILVSNAGIFFFGEGIDTDPVRAKTMAVRMTVMPGGLIRLIRKHPPLLQLGG